MHWRSTARCVGIDVSHDVREKGIIGYTEQRCWVCNAIITWGQSDTACKMRCRERLYAESYRIERHKQESYR